MATRTGGKCEQVENVADLPDILLDIVSTQIDDVALTVDGSDVVDESYSPPLPFEGPGDVNATTDQILGLGLHRACVSAFGQSPYNNEAPDLETLSVQCCKTFEVAACINDQTGSVIDSGCTESIPLCMANPDRVGGGCAVCINDWQRNRHRLQ